MSLAQKKRGGGKNDDQKRKEKIKRIFKEKLSDEKRYDTPCRKLMLDLAAATISSGFADGREKSIEEYEQVYGLDVLMDALEIALEVNKSNSAIFTKSWSGVTQEESAENLNKMLQEVKERIAVQTEQEPPKKAIAGDMDLVDDDYDHVEEGLTPEQQKELNGQLLKAVREGNLDKVKEAYGKGADLGAVDEEGKSVWHYAEEGGHNEITAFFDGIDAVYQRMADRMLDKLFSESQYKVDEARVDVLTDEVLKKLWREKNNEPENGS